MNANIKLLFINKVLYDVYFYGAITIPFFVSKGYDVSTALIFASLYMVATMAMEVPTGVVGDRYGHKISVIFGAFVTGTSLLSMLVMDGTVWDGAWVILFATGSALTSGSDTALIRFSSDNFEKDNRTFEYLKSVMLLLSFAAAGFVVKYLSIELAIGLSGALAFASILPLLLLHIDVDPGDDEARATSFRRQVADLPNALRKVRGGLSLVLLAGLVGAITFSAKEIISSFNTIYDIDIAAIGLIAALAMAGRIVGTAIEKRLNVGHKPLLAALSVAVALTSIIEFNRVIGVTLLLLSTVLAQMIYYRLKFQLASEAPRSHIASLVSGLGLAGKLISGGMILITSVFAGIGYFYLSFIATSLVLVAFGGYLAFSVDRANH